MTASELMVGDWVLTPCTPTKVKQVRENCILGSDGHRGLIDESELEPIPITPEILEKNGFTHDGTIIDYGGINIKSFSYNNSEIWGYLDGQTFEVGFHGENPVLKLYYVHQLQQALRLCGITKEIKL